MCKNENTYNSQQVAAVSINTHCTILKVWKKTISWVLSQVTFIIYMNECFFFLSPSLYDMHTYPRFGPFGAKIGNTIPTNPQRAVIMNTGNAPILVLFQLFLMENWPGMHNQNEQNNTLRFLLSIYSPMLNDWSEKKKSKNLVIQVTWAYAYVYMCTCLYVLYIIIGFSEVSDGMWIVSSTRIHMHTFHMPVLLLAIRRLYFSIKILE